MATKSVSIRIEEEMLRKAAYVADYEGRSINSHILVLVRRNIQEFEDTHGKIEDPIPHLCYSKQRHTQRHFSHE